jgi:CGNR zinc finger protein/putative stress-induced transcription regulator
LAIGPCQRRRGPGGSDQQTVFAGETLNPPNPQPGHRRPAPGQLALVQAFLNTHFDLGPDWGAEVLRSPVALDDWLVVHGLTAEGAPVADRDDLNRALALRRSLRDVVQRPDNPGALHGLTLCADGAPATVQFTPAGARFAPAPGHGARTGLGVLIAVVGAAMLDGTWGRLKLCPGEHCGWAFYDQSRNRSGRWCSMSVCGGRTKARAHYARTLARERSPR